MICNCPFSEHGICAIATRLADTPVKAVKEACEVCVKELVPMAPNKVTAGLAVMQRHTSGKPPIPYLMQLATGRDRLPGNVLERYVNKWMRRLGIKPPLNCGCDSWVKKMNAWGTEECLLRLDEITNALADNLKKTYLSGIAFPVLTKPLIKRMVRSCLLRERS